MLASQKPMDWLGVPFVPKPYEFFRLNYCMATCLRRRKFRRFLRSDVVGELQSEFWQWFWMSAEGKKGGPERMLCLSLLHVQAVVTSRTIVHLRLWKCSSSTPGQGPGSEEQQTLHMPCRPLLSSWIWQRSLTAFIEKHTYHHYNPPTKHSKSS